MARGYFVSSTPPARFEPGEQVRMIGSLGGALVTVKGVYDRSLDLWQIETQDGKILVVSGPSLERRYPTWQPGDVIVVRHHGSNPGYTYVRSQSGWLTDHGTKTDAQINRWFSFGWVTPKLQNGGQPFDPIRL